MATAEPTRCQATNQQGQPCSAAHYRDGWCRWHHPGLGDQRKAWAAKGGANRSNKRRAKRHLPAEPLTADEVQSWLGVVFRGVIAGKIEPGVATAAANVARALMTVKEVGELEERMGELERRWMGPAG